jgi:Skp family chaperone for outer membrane proteins
MYMARRLRIALLALGIIVLAVAGGHTAVAQDAAPPLKVGVLDMQQIMRDSKAAKALLAELNKRESAYKAEVIQKEKALNQAREQLAKQRGSLSQADFEKKLQDLEAQYQQFSKEVTARRQQLVKLESSGRSQIGKAVQSIVTEIAKAKGITLVLYKSQIVLTAKAFEITAETLKKLDAKLPTVNLAQQ